MVGGGALQQPQAQPHAPISTTTTIAPLEEEALKRSTDCVYFLASPLTCKKGSECEYRHSDIARVNPRDCWFWLNGNCLNPKCGFRHPPLDGLLGAQVPTPVGSSLPGSQFPATPVAHSNIFGKQGVLCIFFQKGLCLKGDRCPFMHGPNSVNSTVPQASAATLSTDLPNKAFGGLEKCTQEQKVLQVDLPMSAELPSQAITVAKVETAPTKNGIAINKNGLNSSGFNAGFSGYRTTKVPPVTSGNSGSRSNPMHEAHVSDDYIIQNGKDTDEFSREPSPGFDVLVDDELRDSDYYHIGRRGHEGRDLNPMNEHEDHIGHSADYKLMADANREKYGDLRSYDSHECLQEQYAWEQQFRASSERNLGGFAHQERRRYSRVKSPDQIDDSDLRYHLSKQRKVGGLRSVINHEYARENHEDRGYLFPQRGNGHLTPIEGSLGSRLRGRIKIPGRSLSPLNGIDLLPVREMDQGRNHGRLSPGKPLISAHQGKLRDRIKGRVREECSDDGRSFRVPRMRKDMINANNTDFAGPKSLAELKVGKSTEHLMNDQQSLEKRKYPELEDCLQYEADLSFEGPKPLSEILKRKRGVEAAVSGSGMTSGNHEENIQEIKESLIRSTVAKVTPDILSLVTKGGTSSPVHNNNEGNIGRAEDGIFHTETGKSTDVQLSLQSNASELGTEDGMIVDEAMEDHEPEGYDQEDGEYDYEQDGEDYNLEEGENADPEDEYLDDDGGDDFAKKM